MPFQNQVFACLIKIQILLLDTKTQNICTNLRNLANWYKHGILYKSITYLVWIITACRSPTGKRTSFTVMPCWWHSPQLCFCWISLKLESGLRLPGSRRTPSISFRILDATGQPLPHNKFGSGTHFGLSTSLHNDSDFGTTNGCE